MSVMTKERQRGALETWRLMAIALVLVFIGMTRPALAACDTTLSLIDFGRLDLDRGGHVTGELIVTCDSPGRFHVGLSEGIGEFTKRKMRGSEGAELQYNLFVDPGRQRVWGDGVSAGTQTISAESDGRRPTIIPVYGHIPSRQRVLTGAYSDNLVVMLEKL